MSIKMIHTDRLRKGMFLASDVVSKNGVILVPGQTTVTKEVLEMLARHFIEYVNIENETEPAVALGYVRPPEEKKDPVKLEEFKETFKIAKEDIETSLDEIVFHDKEIDISSLLKTVNVIIGQTNTNLELCDLLFAMKEVSSGIYSHSINVALISQLLANWIKMGKEEIELVVLSGLLHDIGKLKFPKELLEKKEKLLRSEQIEFEKHVIYGYRIIENKNIDGRVKQAVLTHHECIDGSGYPLKVGAGRISKISRVIAIADNYDIMTAAQHGQEQISPFEAVHKFEEQGHNKYDVTIMMPFLTNILSNFVHHKVLLSDGQIGEIVLINKYDLSKPLVKIGFNFVDLSQKRNVRIVKVDTGYE